MKWNMNLLMDYVDDSHLEESMVQILGFQSLKMIGGVENTKKNLSQMTNNFLKRTS